MVSAASGKKTKPPVDSLTRKLLRDMKDGWKSFVAIWIICTLAITLYVGIDSVWRCIEDNLDEQFTRTNMAQIWVSGAVTDRTARDIAAIPGVTAAQQRVSARCDVEDLEGEPAMMLTMSDGDAAVNQPLIFEGGFAPGVKDQCILQQVFAEYHGLKIGDVIRLKLGDRALSLTVAGIGVMPEYVVTADGGEMTPSPTRYGYAFVSPGTLSFLPYDEVVVALADGVSAAEVRVAVEDLLHERQAVVKVREDIIGIKMAVDEAQQVRAMGAIFPVVFFVIAALITWTTMSRLVENQRTQIGSMYSMGYGRQQLTMHFASYGLLLAALGCVAGFSGALFAFAPIIMNFLEALYVLPNARLKLDPYVVVIIAVTMALITGGASVLSARSALRQTPAALLRPKPPSKGKRIFLERFKRIWARLGFSSKMITRNMARNPVRLTMGLIGALGCAALMLTGFGMRDSTAYVFENHYNRSMIYDARASLLDTAGQDYGRSVAARAGASAYEEEMQTGCEALEHGDWKSKSVFVLEDQSDMIRLYDGEARVILPEQGVALTRKAAEEFGVQAGDPLQLRLPGGRAVETTVTAVVDLQLDQGIYASRTAWRRLNLTSWRPTDVLMRGEDIDTVAAEALDGVDRCRTVQEERNNKGDFLKIMNIIVLLLVLFSGVLALVVFYNLGQLNFSERVRELATLKVLGFTPNEIKKLVLRENLYITFIGLPLGLVAGPFLLDAVLTYGLPNTIQFVPYLTLPSWIYTAALTIVFALLVNWMLGSKFHQISMVEALKSVE